MRRFTTSILAFLLLAALVSPALAQKKKLAQTGFQFLTIGLSARAEGMGGAYSLVGDDADAMFYNPAGLSRMGSGYQVVAHRIEWIADIAYTVLGVAHKGNLGVLAASFGSVDYGDLIGTQVAANEKGYTETGVVDVGGYFVGFAYSKQLTNKFAIGSQVKYVAEHLGSNLISPVGTPAVNVDNNADALNFTFGTIYYTGLESLRLGINIRNFSPQIRYEKIGFQLPLTFHIGMAMDVLDLYRSGESAHSLEMALDATHPRDFSERIYLGAEYWFQKRLALRGGYRFNHDTESFTLGVGLRQRLGGETQIRVDYSFTQSEFFNSVSRFSVGVSF